VLTFGPTLRQIHISGESLLNDGAAVVFFNIFSMRFFYEMGIPGFGEDIGWGQGELYTTCPTPLTLNPL